MKKQSLVSESLMYTAGHILYLLSQWLVSVVIVRISGLDDAGYFGVALTTTSVFYMIASYGIRSYQISDLKPMFSDSVYVSARLYTTAIGLAGCMIYAWVLEYNAKQITVIGLYMLFKCCEALYDVLHGIWQKKGKLINVGVALTIKAILSFCCFIVPYWLSKTLVTGLICMLISAIVLLISDWYFTVKKLKVVPLLSAEKKAIINLLKVTFVMMIFILCSPLLAAIPRIILEKNEGREVMGIYTSLATPTTLITAFASTVFLPLIPKYTVAYEQGNYQTIKKLLAGSSLVMIAIGCAAVIAIYFLGHWAINLVYGEAVAEHYQLMHGVVISVVLSSIIMCLNNFLTGIRKLYHELLFMAVGCIICLAISLVLVPVFSMSGAILAMIVSQGIQVLMEVAYIFIILRKEKIKE